jgi:hypothetical protein
MENYLLPENKKILAGLFSDKSSAEEAYFDLKAQGYSASEINVLMSKETHFQYYSDNFNEKSHATSLHPKDTPGGIADDVCSFGTNVKIPWPGLVVSGPLENDFNIQDEKGYHTIMDAVSKAGIPKDDIVRYIEGINDGKILITVYSHSENGKKTPLFEKVF